MEVFAPKRCEQFSSNGSFVFPLSELCISLCLLSLTFIIVEPLLHTHEVVCMCVCVCLCFSLAAPSITQEKLFLGSNCCMIEHYRCPIIKICTHNKNVVQGSTVKGFSYWWYGRLYWLLVVGGCLLETHQDEHIMVLLWGLVLMRLVMYLMMMMMMIMPFQIPGWMMKVSFVSHFAWRWHVQKSTRGMIKRQQMTTCDNLRTHLHTCLRTSF